jgi:hypothetical protein
MPACELIGAITGREVDTIDDVLRGHGGRPKPAPRSTSAQAKEAMAQRDQIDRAPP